MEVLLQKMIQGHLVPVNEDEADKLRRIKAGATVRCDITQMRNAAFFRKWWALAKLAFDVWTETVTPYEYKGQAVLADFDRFRRDLTILAGFYRPVFNARGEVRLEAESLKWSQMDEDRFEALYSKTIDAVLQKVIPKAHYSEQSLRAAVDRVMEFS
jgi:hypothetical protein